MIVDERGLAGASMQYLAMVPLTVAMDMNLKSENNSRKRKTSGSDMIIKIMHQEIYKFLTLSCRSALLAFPIT